MREIIIKANYDSTDSTSVLKICRFCSTFGFAPVWRKKSRTYVVLVPKEDWATFLSMLKEYAPEGAHLVS